MERQSDRETQTGRVRKLDKERDRGSKKIRKSRNALGKGIRLADEQVRVKLTQSATDFHFRGVVIGPTRI